jgi:DNA-binding transcriptional LysR family regulator
MTLPEALPAAALSDLLAAMTYTLRQLEIFVEAARDCSFAGAADRLGISQPAVSDHVRALERNLCSELFVRRRGSRSRLTPAGERLRQEAEDILERGARLREQTAEARRTVSLKLFAGPHIFDCVLRSALPAFHRAHPGIALNISSELSYENIGRLIDRRELDIAVFTAAVQVLPVHAQVLSEVSCVVVASRRLAGDAELTPAEVGRLPFVLPLQSASNARWVDRTLAELGVTPENIIGRTQFLDVQQRMVENGEAAALLFRENFEMSRVRHELRPLTRDAGGLRRALVMRPGEDRPEVHAVASFVRESLRGLSAPAAADAGRPVPEPA